MFHISSLDALAREAYTAYGAVTNFKNFRGEPMPEFDALPETIQDAWKEAARRVAELTS